MIKTILKIILNIIPFGAASIFIQEYYNLPIYTFGDKLDLLIWMVWGMRAQQIFSKWKSEQKPITITIFKKESK